MANDLGDWFNSIPPVSRYWFAGSVVAPLLGRFGLLSAGYMIMSWDLVLKYFHIWRPFTAVFYYPITPQTGFHYLMTLYFLYSYSTRLESGLFSGRRADYLFVLFFNWLVILVIAFFTSIPLFMEPLVFSVLYIWCQINKDTIVQFWFGTQFKAMYMPWILLAFNMIIRGGHSKLRVEMPLPRYKQEVPPPDPLVSAFSSSHLPNAQHLRTTEHESFSDLPSTFDLLVSSGFVEIMGILVGHVYYFLKYRYPVDYGGTDFLQTPEIFYKFLPNQQSAVAGFGVPPAFRNRPAEGQQRGGYQWGRGNILGRD